MMITRGLAALESRRNIGRQNRLRTRCRPSIAACHARATPAADTDWQRIAALYAQLGGTQMPSPIVELNRAVAVSMAFGPEPALVIVDGLQDEPRLAGLPFVAGSARRSPGEGRKRLGRSASASLPAGSRGTDAQSRPSAIYCWRRRRRRGPPPADGGRLIRCRYCAARHSLQLWRLRAESCRSRRQEIVVRDGGQSASGRTSRRSCAITPTIDIVAPEILVAVEIDVAVEDADLGDVPLQAPVRVHRRRHAAAGAEERDRHDRRPSENGVESFHRVTPLGDAAAAQSTATATTYGR